MQILLEKEELIHENSDRNCGIRTINNEIDTIIFKEVVECVKG